MRYIGYSLLGVMFLAIAMFIMNWFNDTTQITGTTAPVTSVKLDDEDYRKVNAYDLPEDSVIRIGFSPSATTTKLLLYAVVNETETPETETTFGEQGNEKPHFRFSVEYRFNQNEDFQKIDLSTQLTDYRHLETGLAKPSYRMGEASLRVTDSRSLEFSIPAASSKSLELKLADKDQSLESVVFRSYYTESTTISDSQRRWSRLSRREQNKLARFHPFGRQYLSEIEIRNLLSKRNQVIAPNGVSGQDFIQRSLWSYQYPDLLISNATQGKPVTANLGLNLKQTLRVLENTSVEFAYQTLNEKPSNISYLHRALNGDINQGSLDLLHAYDVGEGKNHERHDFAAGDYIFYADQLINFEVLPSQYVELSQLSRRFYSVNDAALMYPIAQSINSTQVIKLNLLATPDAEFGIKYEFKNESDEVILSDVFNHQQPQDPFSSVQNNPQENTGVDNNQVSISSEHQLRVPKGVSKLVISPHNNRGLIRVSNSLESLAPKVILSDQGSQFHSNWFELQPEQPLTNSSASTESISMVSTLSAAEAPVWVTSYERYAFVLDANPTQVQKLSTGKLLPINDFYEVIEAEDSEPSAIVYKSVRLNKTINIDIEPVIEGDGTVVLQALYQRKNSDSSTLVINVDGKAYSYDLLGRTGLVSLPPIKTGKHRVKIQASKNFNVYLNHLATGSSISDISYKKRSFSESSRRVTYPLNNAINAEQTLQILLADTATSEPFSMSIHAKNSRETRLIRHIEISPQKIKQSSLLSLNGKSTYSMIPPVYVPLNELGSFRPDQIEILFDDSDRRLLSVGLLDRSEIKFNRAFSDAVERVQIERGHR